MEPFATPEWQRAWWAHLGSGELVVHDLGDLGTAAVCRSGDEPWRFLGGRDVTDYPGPSARSPAVAAALVRCLADDGFDAVNQPPAFAAALAATARAAGRSVRVVDDEAVAVLALPGSWSAYADDPGRRELRRKRRRLGRERPAAAVRGADATTLAADLDRFVALHRASAGAKGGFFTPSVEAFVRDVAWGALARGTLRLDLLEDGDALLAATLAFEADGCLYLYNMAHDRRARALSPGIVLLSRLIERAITDGLQRFDFLRGLEPYKLDLGAEPRRLRRVEIR